MAFSLRCIHSVCVKCGYIKCRLTKVKVIFLGLFASTEIQ